MPKKLRFSYAGFTLVELLVAISIIGLVAGITISSASSIQRSSRDAQRKTDLSSLQSALQQYYTDQGYYPDDLTSDFSAGAQLTNCSGMPPTTPACVVSKVYLQKIPKDPNSATPYGYRSQIASPAIISANDTPCSGATSGKCQFYSLCAAVEGAGQTPSPIYCVQTGVTYTYGVSPL
jgi:type II secretion system protein G